MSLDLEARILHEPAFAGVNATSAPDWFAPHDDAPLGYWRKPDGHIILAQYGENGTEKKLDRGFQRLGHQYGSFASAGTRTWTPSTDPLYPLVAKGGIREIPGDQLKLLGWHRKPDRNARASHRTVEALVERQMAAGLSREKALLAVMPQLASVDLTDYDCAACPGRLFPTEAAKIAHTSVVHKEAIQSESIGKAVAAAQSGGGSNADLVAALTDALKGLAPASGGGDSSEALLSIIEQQGEVIAGMKAQLDALTAKAPKGKLVKAAQTEEPAAE